VNHRRLPVLAVVLAMGTYACGDAGDDSSESVPTSETVAPPTTAELTELPTTTAPSPTITPPLTSAPIKDTTPGDLAPTTPPEVTMTGPSVPTRSNVEIAVADLAARLDVDPTEIEIVSVDEVTWPDGSLGCPHPGMSYTQALVDGQLIVLAVDDTEYEYHSGRAGEPFYCPADQATPPVPDPRT
jgi:hypothetical protein